MIPQAMLLGFLLTATARASPAGPLRISSAKAQFVQGVEEV